jgi:hypothetical protein
VLKRDCYRCTGHSVNLAPRFRAIEPPDRPGLNLRWVVRVDHPLCHQNGPENVHYPPVLCPSDDCTRCPQQCFPGLGPLRAVLRAPTAPKRCGRGADRRLSMRGRAPIRGFWPLSTRGALYDPLPARTPPWFGGLRWPGRCQGARHCPHAPGGPSRLLDHPHHAKIKPGLKPGVSLNRRGRPGCAWKDYRGSGMCTGRSGGLLQTAYNQARKAQRVPLTAVGSAPGARAQNGRIGNHTNRP